MAIKKPAVEGGKGKILKFRLDDVNKEYWEAIGQLCRYGVSASDGKGPRTELKMYCTQLQKDIIIGMTQYFPSNFFSSQAAMLRFIMAVGSRTVYEYLKNTGRMDRELKEFYEIFEKMCILGLEERKTEFIEKFQTQISSANKYIKNEKVKTNVNKLLKLLEKFVNSSSSSEPSR